MRRDAASIGQLPGQAGALLSILLQIAPIIFEIRQVLVVAQFMCHPAGTQHRLRAGPVRGRLFALRCAEGVLGQLGQQFQLKPDMVRNLVGMPQVLGDSSEHMRGNVLAAPGESPPGLSVTDGESPVRKASGILHSRSGRRE